MRVITVPHPVPPSVLDCEILPNVEYLVHDQQVFDISRWRVAKDRFQMQWARANAEQRQLLEQQRPFYEGQISLGNLQSKSARGLLKEWRFPTILDKKKILFIRPGGYGDLIMLLPLLKKIKTNYKRVTIGISCLHRFGDLINAMKTYVDEWVQFPIRVDELEKWDYHVNFEGTIEGNKLAETKHGAEMFGEVVGWPVLPDDHKVIFEPGDHIMPDFSGQKLPDKKPDGEKWVGIFCSASARQRNWPVDWLFHLMNSLCLEGYKVFPLGKVSDFGAIGYHPHDGLGDNVFAGLMRGPGNLAPSLGAFQNLPQLADFMRRYLDLIITPDTVGVHLAGVLGLKCLALYGPFPAEVRTKYYPTVEVMQGKAPCAPCFSHGLSMPCTNPWCLAMDDIRPEQVYAWVKKNLPLPSVTSRIEKIRLLPNAGLASPRLNSLDGSGRIDLEAMGVR
jgi:ADP-heptose:LPS heptosyltransferase